LAEQTGNHWELLPNPQHTTYDDTSTAYITTGGTPILFNCLCVVYVYSYVYDTQINRLFTGKNYVATGFTPVQNNHYN